MNQSPFKRYVSLVLAAGSVVGIGFFVYAMLYGHLPNNFWIFRCNASAYSDENYLAYCADGAYGDYAHGALFQGNDAESVKSLKRAKVLFLGNSRTLHTFSSENLMHYFNNRKIPFFNLGMGYNEFDVFPMQVIKRHDLSPKVLVVNVDYFFYNSASLPARKVMGGNPDAILEYKLKAWVQPWHKKICGKSDHILRNLLCSGDKETYFRSRINGRIFTPKLPKNQKIPADFVGSPPLHMVPVLVANARKFKRFAEERNVCLVLTYVPSPLTSPIIGQEIAKELGLPFILAGIKNLTTEDGSHMNLESAERWSKGFLPKFEPILDECLARAPGIAPAR